VWEYPCNEQQGVDFLSLLATIRMYLPEDGYLLTAALPASKSILQCINPAQSATYLNFINLTAYDFFGSWTPRVGHQSQLYNMSKDETSGSAGASYLMRAGVPGRKILLGIPLFGRSFLHATEAGQKFKGVGGEDGTFEYKDLPRKGTREQIDKRSVGAYCVGGDGGFVSYDSPETVKAKAAFCKQKGLGVSLVFWYQLRLSP
jgi:chitinase